MALHSFRELVTAKSRVVQQKGRVVLPKEWRDEHGVKKGDRIVLKETDDGTLEVIPPE